jgi:hypothetical protein
LPTTTHSSDPRRAPRRSRWGSAGACLGLLALVCGCVTPSAPDEFFQLSPDSAKHRAAQIRLFDTSDTNELLSASAAALQDLGFQIEESVREVGFLRAAKERSARERRQDVARVVAYVLSMGNLIIPVDLHQKIAASLVIQPGNADATHQEVRIMFYRVVWKGDGAEGDQQIPPGEQRMEMIRDPEIYQQFFAKLSKAVFLEAHKI